MEFYTADEHYFHGNIIKYCSRPVKDVRQMHKMIVNRHNEKVGPEDTVWHVGDISMLSPEYSGKLGKIIEKLNGTHHLVLGNHDGFKPFNYVKLGVLTVHTAMWFDRAGYRFVSAHDPAAWTTTDEESILLCGHIHKLFKHLLPEHRVINVGIDVWNYEPVSLPEILALLDEFGVKPRKEGGGS